MQIADNMEMDGLYMLAVQKTHVKENNVEYIKTTYGRTHYTIYHSGTEGEPRAGVAVMVNKQAKVTSYMYLAGYAHAHSR